jgi:DUF2075 family protein
MLLKISEFRKRVENHIDVLVADLQETTSRFSPEEAAAWKSSLPKVSHAFSAPLFQPLHVYFGEKGNLSLEYRLPASSSWCDMVLLGAHEGRPSAVIVELKDWQTRTDRPGDVEGLMNRHIGKALHPSEQVRGYAEYCRRFHSAVLEAGAAVHGCVLFTRDSWYGSYKLPPNDGLTGLFPCFAATSSIIDPSLVEFFKTRLTAPHESFAGCFENGQYQQDRNFVRQMAQQVLDPSCGTFELLDNQRFGFALCKAEIEKAIFGPDGSLKKTVIFIEGPPGSGKSVLAGKLWASLAIDSRMQEGNLVLTTTSIAQKTNWEHIFERTAKERGGGGVVVAANKYAPETIPAMGRWMKQFPGKIEEPENWRENNRLINALRGSSWMPDDHMLVSIVDEAHALINPEHSDARTPAGWPIALGPQAYHIVRASTVSVFLLDAQQSFRERESTTVDDISGWAQELGAHVAPVISLAGGQFRCAGAKEYVDWVESLLVSRSHVDLRRLAKSWAKYDEGELEDTGLHIAESLPRELDAVFSEGKKAKLEFRIFDTPMDMESALCQKIEAGATARLIASFARKWRTKDVAMPHNLQPDMQDFQITCVRGDKTFTWSKPWNVVPGGKDYAAFIQGSPGSQISMDPLAEVGCTFAVRGFDFDYIGLLWLGDLTWRKGTWQVWPNEVHETGVRGILQRAKREKDPFGPNHQALLQRVQQAYRILLTRAIKGVYLWFEDAETREYVTRSSGLDQVTYPY